MVAFRLSHRSIYGVLENSLKCPFLSIARDSIKKYKTIIIGSFDRFMFLCANSI